MVEPLRVNPGDPGIGVGVAVVFSFMVPASAAGLLSGADGAGVVGGALLVVERPLYHPGGCRRVGTIHHIQLIIRVTIIIHCSYTGSKITLCFHKIF